MGRMKAVPTSQFVLLYGAGETLSAIARRYGITHETVRHRLAAEGVTMRRRGGRALPLPCSELVARYAEGESAPQLALAYGVGRTAVYRRLRAAGVKMRVRVRGGPLHLVGDGYLQTYGRNGRPCRIHRGCWEAHHGAIPHGYHIHHVNGDPLDNNIENLACMSPSGHSRLHAIGDLAGNTARA